MLGGLEIARLVRMGDIVIDPFDPEQLNPNSYNVRLADELLTYAGTLLDGQYALDPRRDNPTDRHAIPPHGFRLMPGVLYLGRTVERTYSPKHVPRIDGRSSVGRLGISVHVTAGFGDVGFSGTWTLEITCVEPAIVYPGMRIAQVSFSPVIGDYTPYRGKYQGQVGATASRMHAE
jgi:dCTP deaminase